MDSGSIAAVASLLSTLIIAVTAIAAFRQLRHYRNANDIVVYLRLVDQMDAPEVANARATLARAAPDFLSDPGYLRKFRDPTFVPEEFRSIGYLLRFLEHISVLVIKGGVAESLIMAEYADIFVDLWTRLRPFIVERREAFGPYTGRAFEHLAMRAKRYIDSGRMAREYAALERDPT